MSSDPRFRNMPAVFRLLAGFIIFLAVGVAFSVWTQRKTLLEESRLHQQHESALLKDIIRDDLEEHDLAAVKKYLATFIEEREDIARVRLMAPGGKLMADVGKPSPALQPHVHKEPMALGSGRTVVIETTQDMAPLISHVHAATRQYVAYSFFFAVFMGGGLWYTLRKTALDPMAETIERIDRSKEELEERVRERTADLMKANATLESEIARRGQAEKSLRDSEELYRSLVEGASDAIFVADAGTGMLVEANRRAGELVGRPPDQLVGMHQSRLHPPEKGDYYREKFMEAVRLGAGLVEGDLYVVTSAGERIPVEISVSVVEAGGRRLIHGVFRDVRERMRAAAEVREAKEFAENLIRTANVIVVVLDHRGRVLQFNETAERLTGYRKADLDGRDWFSMLVPKERYPEVWEEFLRLQSRGLPVSSFTNPIVTKGGVERIISWQNSTMGEGDQRVTVSFGMDITEQIRAEEDLHKSRAQLAEAQALAHLGSWDLDLTTGRASWSDEEYRALGYAPGEAEANSENFLRVVHPDDRDAVVREMQASMQRPDGRYGIEHRVMLPDGSVRYVFESGKTVFGASGKPLRMVGTTLDVTDRKMAADRLRATLAEKETLLKEIHHRVKNNLQIISSLLFLQSEKTSDPHALELMEESRDRIRSMAIVHEKLYASGTLATISCKGYIESLVSHLLHAHGESDAAVAVEICDEDVLLEMDAAVPCGLIVTELLTNALKYASPEGQKSITLSLSVDGEGFAGLVVRDNGAGLPAGFDISRAGTLGLRLVASLVAQLRGSIEAYSEGGAVFRVRFPVKNTEKAGGSHEG